MLEFDMERAYHSLARKENFVTGEVIEMLKHKVSSIPIRGFTKVELFDEKRFGKKVEEVTAENFISINMKDYLEYILMNEYSKIGAGLNGPDMMPLTYRDFPFNVLALTTDSRPENPQVERVVMGDIIGYSFKNSYVGSDTRRGTLNSAESYRDRSIAHFVFDFATNAANGTFSSVVWYSDIGSSSLSRQLYYRKNFEWYVELKGKNGITNNSDYRGGLCFDGSSFWTMESTGSGAKKIMEILVTPGTNGKNATFTIGRVWDSHITSSSLTSDMTYDSDYIYYVWPSGASNTIYRVKKSDGTRSTITLSGFQALYGIERVGAHFYVLGQSATQVNGQYPLRWAKYDSNFNIIEAKNIFDTNIGAYGMAYNQQKNEIAVRTGNGIFIFDLQMNRLSYAISQPSSPNDYPGIAVKDGEYFLRDSQGFFMAELGSLGARNLLPTPVTKTSTNTMKVTYDFMFV
ncbi:hypothetical protein [Anoxybacillus ayderensis]|uniref:hypothetical protein n=1 Tax=Anoxybacillus ayderensis TaxID=265546 RepID=UPI000A26D677|nr:hypothetical protein [Anoxybacillus ayderensis]OSX53672.1 hypothetical protein B7H16_10515 [Anoxybacillus ayderensis]